MWKMVNVFHLWLETLQKSLDFVTIAVADATLLLNQAIRVHNIDYILMMYDWKATIIRWLDHLRVEVEFHENYVECPVGGSL